MSLSKKDQQLLIGLAGILVAVAVFFLVYQPLNEKAEAMRTENVTLEARIAELEEKVAQKEFYESETARMNTEVQSIYSQFPSNVMTEDAIMLGILEETTAPMKVTGITIDASNQLYLVSQNAAPADATATTETADATAAVSGNQVALYQQPVALNFQVSYEGLKRGISYICDNPNRMSITSLTAAYDNTTGLLTGNTNVNMFFLTGTGKPYTAPSVAGVAIGTTNPFGTVTLPDTAGNGADQSDAAENSEN